MSHDVDNEKWRRGDGDVRLLLGMKHGLRVHSLACEDPDFKARHDAAIDRAVDALLEQGPRGWPCCPGCGCDLVKLAYGLDHHALDCPNAPRETGR